MAEIQSKLEITAKVVDLGDRVIQLHHIVSAGVHARHPFRILGLLLVAAGVAVVAGVGFMNGTAAFKLQSGGSLPLWIGFGAAGIGLFLSLYARRNLLIRTSDGVRFTLPANDDETATALIRQMRHAMESSGPAASYTQSPGAPAILGAPEIAAVAQKPGAPLGLPQHPQQALVRAQPHSDVGASQAAGRHTEGYTNGHAGRGAFGPSGPDGMPLGEAASPGHRRPAPNQHPSAHAGGVAERRSVIGDPFQQSAAREPLSLPATLPASQVRDDGQHDLASLMDHVRRADVQHKEALLDLLRVIEDYYRGRATREDAVAHWRSFADYVVQYLSEVEGLMGHTERFGRHMLAR